MSVTTDKTARDFTALRKSLIDFAKVYYPNTYSDFSQFSPGMMFIEMAAYVGDVLNYYIDNEVNETLLPKTQQIENAIQVAQSLGYVPRTTTVATTTLDVFCVVPSAGTGANNAPNWNYAPVISPGMIVSSNIDKNIQFRCDEYIDFSATSSYYEAPTVSVYKTDSNGEPTYYLLKKNAPIYSGTVYETTIDAPTTPVRYWKVKIDRDDVIAIDKVTDTAGNIWYEVPFMAQDLVWSGEPISSYPLLSTHQASVPFVLKALRTSRRFVRRLLGDKTTELQFGAGTSALPDELIVPNPNNVGSAFHVAGNTMDYSIDPSNFMFTKTYGQAPYATALTVRYIAGGGIKSNVAANSLTTIENVVFTRPVTGVLNSAIANLVKNSVAVNNPEAAVGGGDGDTIDDIRQNAVALFSTQRRTVTKEDYVARIYSLPAKYGAIAKAYVTTDADMVEAGNPSIVYCYILSYDNNKRLTPANDALKENLKTFLEEYRMLTETIILRDAYPIDIAIYADITASDNQNRNVVSAKCVAAIQEFFSIDKWQINQPIVINDIGSTLSTVAGVRNINSIKITNKYKLSDGYSGNKYDIEQATRDGVIYPSMDPCCFQVRYPSQDIMVAAR